MTIVFEDEALRELYVNGFTKDKKYRRLPADIVRWYIKTINYIRAARRTEDLLLIKSLHYEKKQGNLKGIEAVWINGQYRLLFNSTSNDQGVFVKVCFIEISKHYE